MTPCFNYFLLIFELTPSIPPIAPLNAVTKSFVSACIPTLDENASDAIKSIKYIARALKAPTTIPRSLKLLAEINPAIKAPMTNAHVDIWPITENGIYDG